MQAIRMVDLQTQYHHIKEEIDSEIAGKNNLFVIEENTQATGAEYIYQNGMAGCNSRLDAIQADTPNAKLPHLDEYIETRRKAANSYDQAFGNNSGITRPERESYTKHVLYKYTLILDGVDRNGLIQYLEEKDTPRQRTYPLPVHHQKTDHQLYGGNQHLPITDWLTTRIISLPIHTEILKEQQEYIIIENVLKFVNKS